MRLFYPIILALLLFFAAWMNIRCYLNGYNKGIEDVHAQYYEKGR